MNKFYVESNKSYYDANAQNEERRRRATGGNTDDSGTEGAEARIPKHFLCALSSQVMKQPVIHKTTGYVYERSAIFEYLRTTRSKDEGAACPLTGKPLRLPDLVRHKELEKEIAAWEEERVVQQQLAEMVALYHKMHGATTNDDATKGVVPVEEEKKAQTKQLMGATRSLFVAQGKISSSRQQAFAA